MEEFNEEHSKLLFGKEWLTKIDTAKNTPYLFKFYSSTVDLSCCILITDTKHVWAEVLTSQQFARRWRSCNANSPSPLSEGDEEAWRISCFELLSKSHSIGGILELSFEVIESYYADFAFELECETFKWRWETCSLGHTTSAELISKHLIFPLISVNHLAFSSPEAVGEISDTDLEKAVDKVGRTARRTVDTHMKNALSKPRFATTVRRMTAMFNFLPDLPQINSTADEPDLHFDFQVPTTDKGKGKELSSKGLPASQTSATKQKTPSPEDSLKPPVRVDSATESDQDELLHDQVQSRVSPVTSQSSKHRRAETPQSIGSTSQPPGPAKDQESDPDSSPLRPAKKVKKSKISSSSDDDSEAERKRRVMQLKVGSGGVKRGTKQPIKRGGKRF
ncbi:hypothetical protein BDQ12DRAFT_680680 [Crucibulum laeve]|uniref:XLF-like N-terminal domain-containing protein n=1 Tax=Crucibulum laeve TaxID=68775 RepID=A0A5C3M5V1_9AGAR|nr:hypothetical protein BDQ12DRAFT_680680 [Crucibulum laeve]